ncbi:hypothetical protein SMF913_27674 [Streptomyces malaysiensis]|uniref:Uncharacterized protein n=1 Tax=Streptomyces malaysiensis TaxID=92644 RepID=A0A2J7YWC8_STRMQ|nr:hypothetical protein SMF913_27674 [Streptomyces malaysiensis]
MLSGGSGRLRRAGPGAVGAVGAVGVLAGELIAATVGSPAPGSRGRNLCHA